MADDDLQLKRHALEATSFGARVAEEEVDELAEYFVETDHWKRLYRGEVDVVYGPKGSGKSALYLLLVARANELFDREIVILAAE
jgi:polynucleotide 5'-kinase involved in rRNA processing